MTTTEAPPVLLETARLRLRRFTEADAEALVEMHSDPEVMRHLGGWHRTNGLPPTVEWTREVQLRQWIEEYETNGPLSRWALETREDRCFLGAFMLVLRYRYGLCEVGWRLPRHAWGQGYATEAASAMIDKAFAELGVDRMVAIATAANTASINIMKKCGMVFMKNYDNPPFGPAVEYVRDR